MMDLSYIPFVYVCVHVVADMEQLYEMWLQSQKPGWSEESSSATRDNGKQIHMPTDYAEEVVWKLEQHPYFHTSSRSSYSDTTLLYLGVSCTCREGNCKTAHTLSVLLSHVCMFFSVLLRLSIFSLMFQVKIDQLKNVSGCLQCVPVRCAPSSCLNPKHVLYVKWMR